MVAGHRATRRQAITAAEQGGEDGERREKEKERPERAGMDEQRPLLLKLSGAHCVLLLIYSAS